MASEKKASSVSDVGAWAMNVISSVGIIMANKQIMSGYHFYFVTSLTAMHFTLTALVGFISAKSGAITAKHVPLWELITFSIISNSSIVGMNLSLMLNSVGFYQIAKLSMIPSVCVLEWILHNKSYTREVKWAVVAVMLGVGVCTVTDVNVNLSGFTAAFVAVICTSLQQIYIGSMQRKHNIGSFELLSKTAPIQAASLVICGPFVDYFLNGLNVLDYQMSFGAAFFIGLSCTLAVFCNMSQYLCIGRFSAVSFQVLGHMKTVAVLILGWLLFNSVLTLKNLSGMGIAVLGMVMYSWAVEQAKNAPKESQAGLYVKDSFTEEDVALLKSGQDQEPVKAAKDIEMGRDSK